MPEFVFATCQVGAEIALKQEVARTAPNLRFAYSRPGFLTFKVLEEVGETSATDSAHSKARGRERFDTETLTALSPMVFARSSGISLGKAGGATIEERAADV